MKKADLRKAYLEKRRALSAADVADLSRRLEAHFFANVDLTGVGTLHCFIPIAKFHEADTWLIIERIWRDHPHIRTITSRTGPDKDELAHAEFDEDTKWADSNWGIAEPLGGPAVEPEEIDLVLVPLLCIDERGYRVGYGKGFYDRFLAKCRPDCIKIGLSLFPLIPRIDDVAEYDVALDRCVTPDSVIDFA